MENLIRLFNELLGPWSSLVTVVVALPTFYAWWDMRLGQKRRNQRWLDQIRRDPGKRPAVLIVDINPKGAMRPQVEAYLAENLKEIPLERIVEVAINRNVSEADILMIHQEITEKVGRLHHLGADVVHCFLRTPVPVAAMVGAALGNAMRVNLYHNEPGYKNWGPLRQTP